MRVAIYSGAIPSTTFIENLINGLADRNLEILLFGRQKKRSNYSFPNIKIYSTPSNKWFRFGYCILLALKLVFTHPKRFTAVYKEIKKLNGLKSLDLWGSYLPVISHLPEIFHVQWAKDAAKWTFLKKFGVKLIVSFRGTQINTTPICDKAIADKYKVVFPVFDAYHCVSHAIMKEGCKYGATTDKSVVIYPAVKKELLNNKPQTIRSSVRILSVGRDHWKKGYRVAIDAMKLLKERGIEFHYTIVSGGEKEELIHQISQLELTEYVTLIDNLPHDRVLQEYTHSDLFLLPSFEEGVANVVLEAMALGTPVISTDCGGMEEVINDGVNGFIVPLRNPDAIKDAVIRFLHLDDKSRKSMIQNARATIQQTHILDHQIEQMLNLYKKVLNA